MYVLLLSYRQGKTQLSSNSQKQEVHQIEKYNKMELEGDVLFVAGQWKSPTWAHDGILSKLAQRYMSVIHPA